MRSDLKTISRKLALAVCICTLLSQFTYAQWISVNSGTGQKLKAIAFSSAFQGRGYAAGGDSSGIILVTYDAGLNWYDSYYNNRPVNDLSFAPSGYLLCAASFENDSILVMPSVPFPFWDKRYSQGLSGQRTVGNVFMVNDTTVYAPGYKSVNTGENWELQDSSINEFPHTAKGMWFNNDTVGFIVGYSYWGTIHKTTNGGKTWNRVNIPADVWELYSVHFPTANTGYATGLIKGGGAYSDCILKTTDGGNNWNTIKTFTTLPYKYLSSVWATNADSCYVTGRQGLILKTGNGGLTWSTQASGTSQNLNRIVFTDADNGYIVGDSGVILKTTNAGGPVGIHASSAALQITWKCYPNPFRESAIIEISDEEMMQNITFILFDALGQEVSRTRLNHKRTEIKKGDLPGGIYFYEIESNAVSLGKGKLIIQ